MLKSPCEVHVWRVDDDGMRLLVASFTACGHIIQVSLSQDSHMLVYGDVYGMLYAHAVDNFVTASIVVYRSL